VLSALDFTHPGSSFSSQGYAKLESLVFVPDSLHLKFPFLLRTALTTLATFLCKNQNIHFDPNKFFFRRVAVYQKKKQNGLDLFPSKKICL